MKVAITGHTRGLGFACAMLFVNSEHTVLGLSRSNGYDINDTDKIIDAVRDCDVFINNAYDGQNQSILLDRLFSHWANTNKIIINIGSIITVYPRLEKERDHEPWEYRDHKQSLEQTFRYLSLQPHTCQMQLVSPGAIDTKMIAHLNCAKMQADNVAQIIYSVMFNPLIKELTVYE